MKWPIMYENIATPKSSEKAPTILSPLLTGWKSPNPTVVRDVNAKYMTIRANLSSAIS